jgi:hypothetical protein
MSAIPSANAEGRPGDLRAVHREHRDGLRPGDIAPDQHPFCHSKRSEESTWSYAPLIRFVPPAGFFAALRMTSGGDRFVLLLIQALVRGSAFRHGGEKRGRP